MLKPVLITGASSGIGEATAVLLAQKGFRVFAAARRLAKLDALSGLGGGRIAALALDVTDEASVADALARIAEAGSPLYGLVNNAGVSVTGPAELVSAPDWRRQFETNVFGLMNVTRAALPQMRAAGAGRIVNIGSIGGRIASPFMGVYAASKHAVEGVSDALRLELRPFGIRVSLIRPGFINTPFGAQEQEGLERFVAAGGPYADAVETFRRWHEKGHPTGAPPSLVAEAVVHALTASRPNARYTVPARYLGPLALRNLLPAAVTDRIFRQVIGLKS